MTYDELIEEACEHGLKVKELPLSSSDGRNSGKRIAIRKDIPMLKEKTCVLVEEIGHSKLTVGNILDQSDVSNRKQERKARAFGYDKLVGLNGIVQCFINGCRSKYEMAEYLGITEEFLSDAIKYYADKYGLFVKVDDYIIYFEPCLSVLERR